MDLLPIAVIVILLWFVFLALYMYSSRKQRDLQGDLDAVRRMLDASEPQANDEGESRET